MPTACSCTNRPGSHPGPAGGFLTFKTAVYEGRYLYEKRTVIKRGPAAGCNTGSRTGHTTERTLDEPAPATSSSDQANTPSSGNTIQGCLSGTRDNYMLTDASGVMYQLVGDDSQFSTNVNKEVEVTGTASAERSAEVTHSRFERFRQ
jgi:hypothetical protein